MTERASHRRLPRSFLYVPGDRPDLLDKAAQCGTDAVILDLEDSVPLVNRAAARSHVASARLTLDNQTGIELWVRVDPSYLTLDLSASVTEGIQGLFIAKCTSAVMNEVATTLNALEEERGLCLGGLDVVGLVEDAQTWVELAKLCRRPRLSTLGIGETDLLADLRLTRSPLTDAAVDNIRLQVVAHCSAAGLAAPVAPTSTNFRDLDEFGVTSARLLQLGFRSRTAIHPAQVPVINRNFTPTQKEVADAQELILHLERARGGVTTGPDGRLVDAAVVRAAYETIERA